MALGMILGVLIAAAGTLLGWYLRDIRQEKQRHEKITQLTEEEKQTQKRVEELARQWDELMNYTGRPKE